MIYQGESITCQKIEDDFVELIFDNKKESVNKFDAATVRELNEAAQAIAADGTGKGLLVSSAKPVFIVGADITEFGGMFNAGEEQIVEWVLKSTAAFNLIEDLDMPSVTAINGIALGGGMEMALTTDYRVAADSAKVGFPEVQLGIYPGFGGTVRFPRLVGADDAIEWIAGGKQYKAADALKIHAVDAVVAGDKLRDASLNLLRDANAGKFDWKARRAQKTGPLQLHPTESMMVFSTAKGFIAGKAGPHMPAPLAAVTSIEKGARKGRDDALKIEAQGFAKVAGTPAAESLIGLFLNDQLIKKKNKKWGGKAQDVKQAAVLGAGIMGGGIAYQSASKGTPIVMKDIAEAQLDLGLSEAGKLLDKLVSRGKMNTQKMAKVLSDIRPTLNYGDFDNVDIVVEAVVENPKVKHAVLSEVEGQVSDDTILASNTSTISISHLAEPLKRPENFCGMHFFNPVHRMPLVEVIRGEKTSDVAVATTVDYAVKMGKTPIVVNDCPGFLVNRILFPYFFGFQALVNDGADYRQVDKVMEKFGWPMGPAYLLDVVGIDTAHHAGAVMAEGFPERMNSGESSSLDAMYEAERFGQKNGKGYYAYVPDRKGKPKKTVCEDALALVKPFQGDVKEFSEQEIVDRLMIPMALETVRCLEDGIVETANEADMGLILGLGFPPFRGGPLRYADRVGLQAVVECADRYAELGPLYEPTAKLREMAAAGETFYK